MQFLFNKYTRNSILSILFTFVSSCLFGQKLQINTTLSDSKEFPIGAAVQIFKDGENTITDYCIIGESGNCEFDIKKRKYSIKISYLGYQSITQVVDYNKDNYRFDFALKPVDYNLPNVTIIDKIIGLKKNGDTLTYNLKAYIDSTEQDLGDIIEKLPGMDIDNNGNVLVRNKKADHLLIEGKEIINDLHKLATEGIQSDVIKKIELIENYKNGLDEFSGVHETNKVAVNVLLKEQKKVKWIGNLKGYVGLTLKSLLDLNLIKTREHSGTTIFFRYNDINEEIVTSPQSQILKNQFSSSVYNPYKFKRVETPDQIAPNLTTGNTSNKDGLISINHHYDDGDKVENTCFVYTNSVNRVYSQSIERTYFNNNLSELKSENQEVNRKSLNAKNSFNYKWNNRQMTSIEIPVNVLLEDNTSNSIFNVNNKESNSNESIKPINYNLAPSVKHIQKYKHWTFEAHERVEFKSRKNSLKLFSSDSILFYPDGTQEFNQIINYKTFSTMSKLSAIRRWGKSFIISSLMHNSISEKINNNQCTPLKEITADNQKYLTSNFQYGIKAVYDWKWLRAIGSISQGRHHQDRPSDRYNLDYFAPDIMLVLNYFGRQKITFKAGKSYENYPSLLLYNTPIVVDYQNQRHGSQSLIPVKKIDNYSVSFFPDPKSTIVGNKLLYNISVSYQEVEGDLIDAINFADGYITHQYTYSPKSYNFLVNSFFMKRYSNIDFNLSTNLIRKDGYSIGESMLTQYLYTQWNTSMSLRYKPIKKLVIQPQINYLYQSQKSESGKLTFSNMTLGMSSSLRLKDIISTIDLGHNFNSNGKEFNNLNINFDIAYQHNQSWRFFIKGKNVSNIRTNQDINITYLPTYTNQMISPQFRGLLLFGAGYLF